MLFYLTNTLLAEQDDAEYADIYDAVRNIAASAVRGKHLVYADYNAIVLFEKWYEKDPVIGLFFHQMKENYAFLTIPGFLTYHIRVVKDNPAPYKDGDSVGEMAYSVFLDSDSVSQCSLIAENDYDCVFYRYILTWYLATYYPELNIRTLFSDINGSGGETPSAIKKELARSHVSVCIVDTDVRFPGDCPSKESTCRKCRKVNRVVPYYKYKELDVHEIENLIPNNYLFKIDNWNGDAGKRKQAFEKICQIPQIMRFFDIKNGVCRSQESVGPLYEFGKMCYESNPDFIQECSYADKLATGDVVVYPGLIKNALKKTIDYLNQWDNESPELLVFQKNIWMEIGSILLNFGIANNCERIY